MTILAKGNSMLPTLKDGETYNIELLENTTIQIGDIIVYCIDNLIICHRVINILSSKNNHTFYKTKGDNCTDPDPYAINSDMVIGKILI